jgi:hypothetical protein
VSGFDAPENALVGHSFGGASFDPDGPGPNPPMLYVYGDIGRAGAIEPGVQGVVGWNGSDWVDAGLNANGKIRGMRVLDLGNGPEVYVWGAFTEIGGISAQHIAKWDGTTWSTMGSGVGVPLGRVSLVSWDRDGDGPEDPVLIVSNFDSAGGLPCSGIAQWDGTTWSDLGVAWGVSTGVRSYDEDGDGPESPKLFAAVDMKGGCNTTEWLYSHDDSQWIGFGAAYGFQASVVATHDPDGDGHEEELLLVSFDYCFDPDPDRPAERLGGWDGSTWRDLGVPEGLFGAIVSADLDGDGPPGDVLATTEYTSPGEFSIWDGTVWHVIAHGLPQTMGSIVPHDPDGHGPQPAQLVLLGSFNWLVDEDTGELILGRSIAIYQCGWGSTVKHVVFESSPPGLIFREGEQAYLTPVEFLWDVGIHHYVEMDSLQSTGPGSRERFLEWSNGEPRRHLYLVNDPGPDNVRATFATEYELTFEQAKGGHVEPGDSWWPRGSSVAIEAVPDPGWVFETWIGSGEGSYTGQDNPAAVVLHEPIHQRAIFTPIKSGYDFAISASDTDPNVHTAPPAGNLRNIHLWMTCNHLGLSAFEGAAVGSLEPLAFVPASGVFSVGTASEVILAVPGCPTGPDVSFLLGYWIVLDDGGSLCLGPSEANGILGAVDCGSPIPELWPLRVTGFSSDGTPPCLEGTNSCYEGPTPVGLTQLRAVAEDRAVQLTWFWSADRGYDGFWIYRGDFPEVLVKLTSEPWRGDAPHEYLDEDVEPNRTYFYRVGGIAELGREELSELVEITTPDWAPILTQLSRIRPNPFLQTSEIEFTVAKRGPIRVSIYDISGRLIRTLLDAELPAGGHATSWDGTNAAGQKVTGGVYLTRLEAAGTTQARKTVFLGSR